MSDVLSTPPEDVLQQRITQAKLQKQLELDKSRILYEQLYQAELQRLKGAYSAAPTQQGLQPTPAPESFDDFYSKIRKAYGEAYALRAFREVMKEATEETGQPPQTMPSADSVTTSLMKSGLPPQVVNQWLKTLEPEALGTLVALSTQNPMLAPMMFALSQRGGQQNLTTKDVVELFATLSKRDTPNVSLDIPRLIEVVKAQPPTTSPTEMVNATIQAIQTGMQLAAPKGGGGEPKPRLGFLESLISQGPEGMKIAKEIGLIGGDAPYLQIMAEMQKNNQTFQQQMKASDRAWDLRLKELELRGDIERAKLVEGRRRTQLFAGAFQRVGGAIARGIGEGLEEPSAGKKAEGKTEEGKEEIQQYKCECGAIITVPPEIQVGAIVKCAKCGAEYDAVKPSEAQK